MEQELNTNKTHARASHGAVEDKPSTNKLSGKTDQEKIDQVAMKAAKRGENRQVNNEEKIPGSTIFSK